MKKLLCKSCRLPASLFFACLFLFLTMTAQGQSKNEKVFVTTQIPAQFPGGKPAWLKYLSRSHNADALVKKGSPPGTYKVTVSFVVAEDGSLSDIRGLNDPGYGAKAEAERLIKKGPKWLPAIQNGKKVKYRHKQAITFQVSDV